MSRYSPYSEKTFARHFSQPFDFVAFNYDLIAPLLSACLVVATDTTFVAKAGKHTYGLDRFFDSTVSRARRGLEVSTVALIDAERGTAYPISARQTPAFERTAPRRRWSNAAPATSPTSRRSSRNCPVASNTCSPMAITRRETSSTAS